jgi:hypothetical protein
VAGLPAWSETQAERRIPAAVAAAMNGIVLFMVLVRGMAVMSIRAMILPYQASSLQNGQFD